MKMNENANTTTPKLWNTVKAVLRETFIVIQAYLKKQGKSQINNPILHLKKLEMEEMKNSKFSRRKGIFKIRADFLYDLTHFNAILPNHPTFSLSHRVQKTVLYIFSCLAYRVIVTIFLNSLYMR